MKTEHFHTFFGNFIIEHLEEFYELLIIILIKVTFPFLKINLQKQIKQAFTLKSNLAIY